MSVARDATLLAALLLALPCWADAVDEAQRHPLFGYARGRQYDVGLSRDACSVKADKESDGAAVVFVGPGWVWREGAIFEGCWQRDRKVPSVISVCVVRGGKFIGECSYYDADAFVDPATLPKAAFQ